jgi:parallel beta-helix repeat protein
MGKRWAILGVLVLGLAVAGGITYAPDRAHAAQVSCGDTITADTTLHHDLVDCPLNGIVIGADNVTLDLNGHTIDGDGTAHPVGGGRLEDSGVSVVVHDGITVMNGSIRQFEDGLSAFGTRDIRLLGLATSENNGFGIGFAAAARILVQGCSSDRNDAGGGGLLLTIGGGPIIGGSRSSDHVRVVNSSFRDNASDGIRSIGSTDNVIEGSLLSGNGGAGIAWDGNRSRLSRNRVVQNGHGGIPVTGGQNVIARNRVSDSGRVGIGIGGGRGNLLVRNVVAGAATNIRISGELEPGRGGAVHTVIRGNRLRRADDDGLLVQETAKRTLLRHNSARDSQNDGFDVDDRTTKLSRNRAVRNHDLGMEAVRGVRDGGGNIARHNGDPRQCTNVKCH